MKNPKIEFTRISNDTNGNPRYVCHFLNMLTKKENEDTTGMDFISRKYAIALNRARKMGGRKFHNKQYGGGIVFQSYNIGDTEKRLLELMKEKRKKVLTKEFLFGSDAEKFRKQKRKEGYKTRYVYCVNGNPSVPHHGIEYWKK